MKSVLSKTLFILVMSTNLSAFAQPVHKKTMTLDQVRKAKADSIPPVVNSLEKAAPKQTSKLSKGGVATGGGVGFLCGDVGGRRLTYLADTYDLVNAKTFSVLKPSSPSAFMELVVKMLNNYQPAKLYPHPENPNEKVSLGWLVTYTFERLKFKLSEDPEMPLLDDDFIDPGAVPLNCKKIQLAVQDIPSKTVRVSSRVSDLTWVERGFLNLHETLIAIREMPGADTTDIRKAVDSAAELMHDKKYLKNILTARGDDCHFQYSELAYRQLGVAQIIDGEIVSYPYDSWTNVGSKIYQTMQSTSDPSRFVFSNAEYDLNVNVIVKKNKALFYVTTANKTWTSETKVSKDKDNVSSFTGNIENLDPKNKKGFTYTVYCSLGLGDLVEGLKSDDEQQMDLLGPKPDWYDQSAVSLEWLPVGTELELTEDLEIIPGTDTAEVHFFEQKGLITHGEMMTTNLIHRLANAEFHNANNTYMYPAFYSKGMKLVVTKVERNEYYGGKNGYILRFETKADPNLPLIKDPITWMKVDGRRNHDIKIPQFAELLKSKFKVSLPK